MFLIGHHNLYFPFRLWPKRAQTVLQSRAQWLPARPATRQEGLQLWPHHTGQSPQHQETHGGGHVHTGTGGSR